MFDLGIQELIVIFVVALLVFGPKRLPELGKTLGKGILELRRAMEGIKDQMREESDALKTIEEGRESADKEASAAAETSDRQTGAESGTGKEDSASGEAAPADAPDKGTGMGKEDKEDGR